MTDNSLTFDTSKSSNNAELVAVKRKLFAKEALVEKKPKAAGATIINTRINLWMKLAINDLISARVIKDPQLFTSPGTYPFLLVILAEMIFDAYTEEEIEAFKQKALALQAQTKENDHE